MFQQNMSIFNTSDMPLDLSLTVGRPPVTPSEKRQTVAGMTPLKTPGLAKTHGKRLGRPPGTRPSALYIGKPAKTSRSSKAKTPGKSPVTYDGTPTKTSGRSKAKTPVSSQTMTPVSSQAMTSVSSQAMTSVSTQEMTPVSSQAMTSVSSQEMTPVSSQTMTPVSSQAMTSVSSQAMTSVSTQEMTPVSSQAMTSVSSQEMTPVSSQAMTPVSSEAMTSVSSQAMASVSSQEMTSVSSQAMTPVSSQEMTSISSPAMTPVSSQAITPDRSPEATPCKNPANTPGNSPSKSLIGRLCFDKSDSESESDGMESNGEDEWGAYGTEPVSMRQFRKISEEEQIAPEGLFEQTFFNEVILSANDVIIETVGETTCDNVPKNIEYQSANDVIIETVNETTWDNGPKNIEGLPANDVVIETVDETTCDNGPKNIEEMNSNGEDEWEAYGTEPVSVRQFRQQISEEEQLAPEELLQVGRPPVTPSKKRQTVADRTPSKTPSSPKTSKSRAKTTDRSPSAKISGCNKTPGKSPSGGTPVKTSGRNKAKIPVRRSPVTLSKKRQAVAGRTPSKTPGSAKTSGKSRAKTPDKSLSAKTSGSNKTPGKSPSEPYIGTPAKTSGRSKAKTPVSSQTMTPVSGQEMTSVSSQAMTSVSSQAITPDKTPKKTPVKNPAKTPGKSPSKSLIGRLGFDKSDSGSESDGMNSNGEDDWGAYGTKPVSMRQLKQQISEEEQLAPEELLQVGRPPVTPSKKRQAVAGSTPSKTPCSAKSRAKTPDKSSAKTSSSNKSPGKSLIRRLCFENSDSGSESDGMNSDGDDEWGAYCTEPVSMRQFRQQLSEEEQLAPEELFEQNFLNEVILSDKEVIIETVDETTCDNVPKNIEGLSANDVIIKTVDGTTRFNGPKNIEGLSANDVIMETLDGTTCVNVPKNIEGLSANDVIKEAVDKTSFVPKNANIEGLFKKEFSDTFSFTKDFSTFTGQQEVYLNTPGSRLTVKDPVGLFLAVWDKEIVEHIVKETNEYAWQLIGKFSEINQTPTYLTGWRETTVEEIYRLFALLNYMSIDLRSSLDEYWTTGILSMPEFRTIMSKNRFKLLMRFLHFVDNNTLQKRSYDRKISKIAPILNHCNRKFSSIYIPQRSLSLDESLLLWKGRISFAQTIRTKAARFGIKSFELCESQSGYLLRTLLYAGKNSSMHDGPIDGFGNPTAKVVLELMDGYLDVGHMLVMDNWYNQLSLTRYLKKRHTDVVGTMNRRRVEVPSEIKDLVENRMQTGDQVSLHCGDITMIAWKDVRLVTAISTFHKANLITCNRNGRPFQKPEIIECYNKNMGGVDMKDQKLSMYLLERKRMGKWYMKIFRRLLNTSILNAYIIYKSDSVQNPKCTHREFRHRLSEGLLATFKVVKIPKPLRNSIIRLPEEIRLKRDAEHDHFPIHSEAKDSGTERHKRRRCAYCSSQGKRTSCTNVCRTCNVGLCIGCWIDYHTNPDLKPKKMKLMQKKGR